MLAFASRWWYSACFGGHLLTGTGESMVCGVVVEMLCSGS
jgi:hypothetical protein